MKQYRTGYVNRQSPRALWWDYANDAVYFVTICTNRHIHYFGEIQDGKMNLSPLGIVARQLWNEITNHAHHVTLGSFIIMPNHVHGILIFGRVAGATEPEGSNGTIEKTGSLVGTKHALSLPLPQPSPNVPLSPSPPGASNVPLKPYIPASPPPGKTRFQNPGKNTLSSVVGSYKSALTKHAHRLHYTFEWQDRFYDHVIRDTRSLYCIDHYIKNNVLHWEYDRFF